LVTLRAWGAAIERQSSSTKAGGTFTITKLFVNSLKLLLQIADHGSLNDSSQLLAIGTFSQAISNYLCVESKLGLQVIITITFAIFERLIHGNIEFLSGTRHKTLVQV
jgi:hypothetical protein